MFALPAFDLTPTPVCHSLPMSSRPPSRRLFLRATVVVALAAVAGVVAGHFVWRASGTVHAGATPRLSFQPLRRRSAKGTPGPSESGRLTGPGAVTSEVDPGLVDIDTRLGYQDGAGAGTGMVLTSSGEVVTNNHVIAGATTITATDIGNGRTYTARVAGYDRAADIAVLQLEGASGLETVKLGDSGSVRVGQSIATIGNAGGAGGTPSEAAGRVSALGQSITASDDMDGSEEQLHGLIQLNGDLQPGDSGGPLVGSSGEVLGMDTAASSSFQFQPSSGEGFAIPIDTVETIATQIVEGRSSSKVHTGETGFLGILVEDQGSGAVVEEVISGTPAASIGLGAGDVITSLDGASISSSTSLSGAILQRHPGESIRVAWRTAEGAQRSANVELASGPPQ